MSVTMLNVHQRPMSLAVSLCALMCASSAFAQNAISEDNTRASREPSRRPTVSQSAPTSPSTTVNLLNLMVKRKIVSQEEADALIKQAENEAYVSRQAAKDATAKADEAAKAATVATAAANPPGTRHVAYVPEIVKRQLREDIKREVMAKAEKENWASPGLYPEWAQRIHFYGDARARYQGAFFPTGNNPLGLYNFNAINTGSPFDNSIGNPYYPPTYNTAENRDQFRFRARLGMDADLSHGFTAGLRLATGENSSPVSTNQTFGANGGNFSKYALWLDRANLKWKNEDLALSIGRFDSPFWSPTDLVWHRDLGFDGVAFQAKHEVMQGFTPFVAAGAFPIYNTDFNAGINLSTQGASAGDPNAGLPRKFASQDKWLFGAQAGLKGKIDEVHSFTMGAAYYDFTKVQGRLSRPCTVASTADVCDTDILRPSFAQKGNTYMLLRDIIADPIGIGNDNGTKSQYQYFGLASQYRPLVVSGQFDFGEFHPTHIVVDGEYVINTAFNRALLNQTAVNNRGPDIAKGVPGPFQGGNQGWLARVTVGDKQIKRFGDWNVHAGYKYLESDATIDAFVDSDFGLGGTNLKGYFVGANVGLSDNVWASLRWMSANSIAGASYAVDVLQVDVSAKF
ncbi:putative porin [Afipia massiliensis]|nr:putative porin [Afipia massiliensis]